MSKIVRSIKNVANGYSSAQVLVRKATSNDANGPATYDMEEIASFTYKSQTDYLEVMDMLDRRLNDKGKNWRHVVKSLTVLDYLVRYGSEKCVLWSKDNLYVIKTLREFVHFDDQDRDQGAIIRVKAKELVSLLNDDERLRQEREIAARSRNGRNRDRFRERDGSSMRRNRIRGSDDGVDDDDLERAIEMSRITAEEEARRNQADAGNDSDLQAALKLSMEEEDMRKAREARNENLLDLGDYNQAQPQYYMATGYVQNQPQYYLQPSTIQYDLFGNPIQQIATESYQNQQYVPQQANMHQPQFTGFHNQAQQPQPAALQPLKTGSNNPFALRDESSQPAPVASNANDYSDQQLYQRPQTQHFQMEASSVKIRPQDTSSSKFGDDSHPELNNMLMQAPDVDTFGNTGSTRIPHHFTKAQSFINSSGTGYKQVTNNDVRVSSNATGNPFLNTGIGYQQQAPIYADQTGYGFGNASSNTQKRGNDGPSLIDI